MAASTSLSGDATSVAFNAVDGSVRVADLGTGASTEVASQGTWPEISRDGRYVAFMSNLSDLVPDDGNGRQDLFVWDRTTGSTTRVTNGLFMNSELISMSSDGRYASYYDAVSPLFEDGLGGVLVWDRATGSTSRLSNVVGGGPSLNQPMVTDDGRYVALTTGAPSCQVTPTGSSTSTCGIAAPTPSAPGRRCGRAPPSGPAGPRGGHFA